MPNQEEIEQQLHLLATHRDRLADLLIQQARLSHHTPHYILQDIRDAREAIRSIKKTLRTWELAVADQADDEPAPTPPAPTDLAAEAPAGSIVVGRDAIGGIFITGNNNSVSRES